MIRARSKKVSLLLVLMMLATLFVGVGSASASTNVWCPGPKQVSDDSTPAIGSLFIDVDPGVLSNAAESLEIKLPTDVEFIPSAAGAWVAGSEFAINATGNVPATNVVIVASDVLGNTNAITAANLPTAVMTKNKITLTQNANVAAFGSNTTYLRIYFNKVKINSGFSGNITATLSSPTNFPTGTVTLGSVATGDATISVGSVKGVAGNGDAFDEITIEEPVEGTLNAESNTVELALPNGFEWNIGAGGIAGAWGFNAPTYTIVPNVTSVTANTNNIGWSLSDNEKTLKIHLGKKSTSKGRITINGSFNINESKAKAGDVEVSVSGKAKPSSLIIANYGERGATVNAGTVADMIAGRPDQKIGDFTIVENAKDSLVGNRTITLTLPSWAKWCQTATGTPDTSKIKAEVTKGTDVLPGAGGYGLVDDDAHILKITIPAGTSSTEAATIKFKTDTKVMLAANASGDLNIEVKGTAGVTGTVKVGVVKAPVSGKADTKADVKIGVASQAVSDLVITEAQAKALMEKNYFGASDGKLIIEAPAGVTFAAVPTVTVTAGNADIGAVTRAAATDGEANRQVVIPITSNSTTASSFKVSGLKLTIDRTVPEGPVTLKFKGAAVEYTHADKATDSIFTNDEWANFTSAGSVDIATVVTPAPGETNNTTVFTLGSATYKINGVEKTASVAPYAENNRTYSSVRDVAYALGITEDNINWNQANQTVTLIKDGKFVQLKLGSTELLVGGVTISMDVAVSAKDNFTTLPASWVAKAFGQTATFDAATNTVTIK